MWEKLDVLRLFHRFSGAKSETRRRRKGGEGWGADLFKIPPRSQTEEREPWEHGTNMQRQLSEVSTHERGQPLSLVSVYAALNKRSFECMLNCSIKVIELQFRPESSLLKLNCVYWNLQETEISAINSQVNVSRRNFWSPPFLLRRMERVANILFDFSNTISFKLNPALWKRFEIQLIKTRPKLAKLNS